MDFLALATHCAPDVHPETIVAIIEHESGGNPFALRNNTLSKSFYPADIFEAKKLINQFVNQKHSVDIGLMQINSWWLNHYKISPEKLLDSCINLQIGGAILTDNYQRFSQKQSPIPVLYQALSAYNTGSPTVGSDYVNQLLAKNKPQITPRNTPNLHNNNQDKLEFSNLETTVFLLQPFKENLFFTPDTNDLFID